MEGTKRSQREALLGAKRRYSKYCYFITIHAYNVKKYVTKAELDQVITHLKMKCPTLHFDTYVYEISTTYQQLHFHGIAFSKKSIYMKRYLSLLGYRLYWKRLKTDEDYDRVVSYLKKQVSNEYEQEQILQQNYYLHNYGFTDSPYDCSIVSYEY